MNQPTLFPDDRYSPARRSDPDTSHEAADGILSQVTHLRAVMLEAFRLQPMTAQEAARHSLLTHAELHNSESLRKRTGELARDGRIECVGKRPCQITGKTARVWRAVT